MNNCVSRLHPLMITSLAILMLASASKELEAITVVNKTDSTVFIELIEYRIIEPHNAPCSFIIAQSRLESNQTISAPHKSCDLLLDIRLGMQISESNSNMIVREQDPIRIAQWKQIGQAPRQRFLASIIGDIYDPIVVPPLTELRTNNAGDTHIKFPSGKSLEIAHDQQGLLQKILENEVPYRLVDGKIMQKISQSMIFTRRRFKKIHLDNASFSDLESTATTIFIEDSDNDISIRILTHKK